MTISQGETKPSNKPQILPPKEDYQTFLGEEHFKQKIKEWGLSTAKKEFWYKERNYQTLVSIKGYESYGNTSEYNSLVMEFPDGTLSCIHPAYLKEMQQSGFGKESMFLDDGVPQEHEVVQTVGAEDQLNADSDQKEGANKQALAKSDIPNEMKLSKPKETKVKKEKAVKIQLPADKIHFKAAVKQFALTYNPFNEENDEVVVLENVTIVQDPPIELGLAWCSHSKTLKKFELVPGDTLEFDGKVAAKKLAKGKDVEEEFIIDVPVLYKINNPSKIMKNG